MKNIILTCLVSVFLISLGFVAEASASVCEGTATVCTGLGQSACTNQDGCSWYYVGCGCASPSNCYTGGWYGWEYASCSGLYWSQCSSCPSCTRSGWSCTGNQVCLLLTQSQCTACSICAPSYACGGTTTQCSSYSSQSECDGQGGCSWNPCEYQGSGDWVLDVSDNCVINEDVTVNGKLVVTGSVGSLTFNNNMDATGMEISCSNCDITFNQSDVTVGNLMINATNYKITFKQTFKLTIS